MSEAAFFGAQFRLRTFYILGGMTMKKTVWLALILLLVFMFSISACDGENSLPTPNDTTSETMDSTTEAETDAHVHAFGEWITIKDVTCTANDKLTTAHSEPWFLCI